MKLPLYVYKRIDGQEYYCAVGRSCIENALYERKKDSAEDTTESVKKNITALV